MERNPAYLPNIPETIQDEKMATEKICNRVRSVQSIYYPCCRNDRRFERLFPNVEIVYLDQDPQSFSEKDRGRTVITGDAHEYICETPADLVILLNPEIFPKNITLSVTSGGYVIANDYHESARRLFQHPDFQLIGSENLEKGWLPENEAKKWLTTVQDDTEWRAQRPESYETAKKLREELLAQFGAIFGKIENIGSMIEWRNAVNRILKMDPDEEDYEKMSALNSVFGKLPEVPTQAKSQWNLDHIYLFRKNPTK